MVTWWQDQLNSPTLIYGIFIFLTQFEWDKLEIFIDQNIFKH